MKKSTKPLRLSPALTDGRYFTLAASIASLGLYANWLKFLMDNQYYSVHHVVGNWNANYRLVALKQILGYEMIHRALRKKGIDPNQELHWSTSTMLHMNISRCRAEVLDTTVCRLMRYSRQSNVSAVTRVLIEQLRDQAKPKIERSRMGAGPSHGLDENGLMTYSGGIQVA
ncbi:hypothetical protein HOI18_05595 [Candidatus Uhrbacteria bacterium]|jgi:hypothetical protein|nr:hypothetical protein [Candidatus Uhrbacteria bacterium]